MSRTARISEAKCIICGNDQDVEMHHIRGLKYLKGISVHTVMMISLNRIQVPLCKVHHRMAHRNGLMALLKQETVNKANTRTGTKLDDNHSQDE